MTGIVNYSPHDTFVGLIGKAIGTGQKAPRPKRTEEFYAGRVSAFVYAAAMLADQAYGCTFADVRHRLMREVRDVHREWSRAELSEADLVGKQATLIATRILDR